MTRLESIMTRATSQALQKISKGTAKKMNLQTAGPVQT